MVKAVDNICHVMEKMIKQFSPAELEQIGSRISEGVGHIIEQSKHTIAVYLNSEVSMTYWRIGKYIAGELDAIGEEKYGSKIVATVSHQLTWSHFVELVTIPQPAKRLFYQQMSIVNGWSVRQLRDQEDAMAYERTLIAAKPEDAVVEQLEKFIMELGQDFAFLERQKKISIDSIDYKLDLLFYHRRLHRLFAIDLKLGKFKPEYKGQMELYLKYLKKYEMQPDEEEPLGMLLCSEGNTEHIELLMLDEQNIKVAQYLTVLPEKQWFIDKLNRSILIAKELQGEKGE